MTQQELDERQSAYLQAQANLAAAQANEARLRDLQGFNRVVAPFEGVVTSRRIDVGDLVDVGNGGAGKALFTVAQVDPLRLYVYVPQAYAQQVKVGDVVTVSLPERPARNIEAPSRAPRGPSTRSAARCRWKSAYPIPSRHCSPAPMCRRHYRSNKTAPRCWFRPTCCCFGPMVRGWRQLMGHYADISLLPFTHSIPGVVFVHGAKYLNTTNAYAYSVDDAVGNIQAEGQGIIIDIGSTQNLENPNPAIPPINVGLGWGDTAPINFAKYRLCKNDPSREKPVLSNFHSFIVSANNPQTCPVYLLDNKTPPQMYTFTVTQAPPFIIFEPGKQHWSQETAEVIDCSGNAAFTSTPSSKLWCCEKLLGKSGNGTYAFSLIEPTSVHQLVVNHVVTIIAEPKTTRSGTTCNMGK